MSRSVPCPVVIHGAMWRSSHKRRTIEPALQLGIGEHPAHCAHLELTAHSLGETLSAAASRAVVTVVEPKYTW